MQPQKHLWTTCSVLLIAALLAACAAPAAAPAQPVDTPAPPAATPVPPAAESDPVAAVQAWADAIYSGDVDAALDLFTDDGSYMIYYTASRPEELRWVFNWLASLETKHENLDCQVQDDKIACTYAVLDGCIAAFDAEGLPVKATFTLQDGKIKMATGSGTGPEWDAYWDFNSTSGSWMRVFRPEEYARFQEGTVEGGKLIVKLCREYENAVKTQEPATAVAAQGLVDAINSGDADAALALFTQSDETKFRVMSNEALGADQMGAMFDYLAGKETQLQITDCEWQGISTQCAVSLVDGCIAVSGVPDGLHGKMTFYSEEDGTLRQVIVAPAAAERKTYEAWLETETAWASANRSDELAQAEGYSQEAGAMAVKLCQEYAGAAKLDDATVAEIEALVEQTMQKYSIPGFALGIVKDGHPIYAKGFGVAEVGSDRPVTSRSIFHTASVNKTVVATAIMQLVEAGKIDLDSLMTDYLPYFSMADRRYANMTVRQVLSHRAGIPNVDNATLEAEFRAPRYDDAALEEYVRDLSDTSLLFAPGEDFSYSCPGFDVLGDVIAKASGESFEEYVQDNIFSPLAMGDTTALLDEVAPETLVSPHVYNEDGRVVKNDYFPYTRIHGPCNNLYTSVDDLSRLALAHLNRGELDGTRILSAAAYDEMWTPYSETGWAEALGPIWTSYGLGWFMGEEGGHAVYNHMGGDEGFQAHILLVPDERLGIVSMVNLLDLEEMEFHAYNTTDAVMKILLGIEKPPGSTE